MSSFSNQVFFKFFKNSLPGFSLFLFIFVAMLPLGFNSFKILPPLALLPIFYWSIYRPDLLPNYVVFFAGLLNDFTSGGPIGLWALIYLLLRIIMDSQRKILVGKTFNVEWLAFILVVPLTFILIFVVGFIFYGVIVDIFVFISQIIITIALYPIVVILFNKIKISIGK